MKTDQKCNRCGGAVRGVRCDCKEGQCKSEYGTMFMHCDNCHGQPRAYLCKDWLTFEERYPGLTGGKGSMQGA